MSAGNTMLLKIKIPDGLDFSSLRMARDPDGMVSFDWSPIEAICTANGIDFRNLDEDSLAVLINNWYLLHIVLHIANGWAPDSTQEELIAEADAENALGGGLSYPPGRA